VAVGCLLVCLVLMPVGTSVAWAVVTILLWTLGEMLSLPMANAIASHRGPPGAGGRFIGAYSLAFSLAFVIGPVTGTAVLQRFGGDVLWLAIGPIGLGLFAGCVALSRRFVPGQTLRVRQVE
jgi:MFS family permease